MAQYIVKSGDTLWSIAQRILGNGARWKELGFTGDPRKMPVGTVLNVGGGGGGAAAAPAGPAPKSAAQIEAENQAAIAAAQKVQADLLKATTDKQSGYAKKWSYDDVKAAENADVLNAFMEKMYGVNTDAYSTGGAGQDWAGIGAGINDGSMAVGGVGDEFLKQLAISAKLYAPEWQGQIDRWKQDALEQEQGANAQYNEGTDAQATEYATNNITGGLKNAAVTNKQNAGSNAFGQIAKDKNRYLEDWKKKQKESLIGYAQKIRNEKIDVYNKQAVAESGMTDPGMISTAYNYGQGLQY
jgi:hypothetical protein